MAPCLVTLQVSSPPAAARPFHGCCGLCCLRQQSPQHPKLLRTANPRQAVRILNSYLVFEIVICPIQAKHVHLRDDGDSNHRCLQPLTPEPEPYHPWLPYAGFPNLDEELVPCCPFFLQTCQETCLKIHSLLLFSDS